MLAAGVLLVLVAGDGGSTPTGVPAATAANAATAGPPHRGGVLKLGVLREPSTLNPLILTSGITDATVINPLMDPLVEFRGDDRPYPLVATKVPTVDNGLVRPRGRGMDVVVPIHPGAAWSDGTPLTCTDVRFTWQTILDERWFVTSRQGWDKVTGVSCPSPKRAVMHFRERYGNYLWVLSGMLVPHHDLAGKDFNKAWVDSVPVGNGPFVFDHWNRGISVTVRRNPRYWRKDGNLPNLDAIRFQFLEDPNTLNLQLSTGEVDLVSRPLAQSADRERKTFPRSTYHTAPAPVAEMFTFNHSRPPFDDPVVRQAIAYAIDREQLVEKVLGPGFETMQSTAPTMGGIEVPPAFARYTHQPDKVRQLLEQAGYRRDGDDAIWKRDGTPLRFMFKTFVDRSTRMQVAQLLQQQMITQGIDMQITMETPEVFFGQTLRESAYDLISWDVGLGIDFTQRNMFHCEPSPGRRNAGRYCNRKVDKLIEQAERELQPERRLAVARQLQQVYARELPVLPLNRKLQTTIYSGRVHGVEIAAANFGWDARNWWVSE